MFPDAWIWTVTRAGGLDVLVGTTTTTTQANRSGPPAVWVSGSRDTLGTIPAAFGAPTLPTTSITRLPPAGALGLVASVGHRIVMIGFDAQLDGFYTFDVEWMGSRR
jgi:hypothetical protein